MNRLPRRPGDEVELFGCEDKMADKSKNYSWTWAK